MARTASDAPPFAGPRRADDTAKAAATLASAPTRMAGPESPTSLHRYTPAMATATATPFSTLTF